MTRKEYKAILQYELYRHCKETPKLFERIRIRYIQPNTNFIFLCRKMWYQYSRGGGYYLFSKLIYLKIIRKYGCIVFPYAKVGRGFEAIHPTGIVIGRCTIGENFTMFQNSTIGVNKHGDESMGLSPTIGNNVIVYCNCCICGSISIADETVIGANSFVNKDILTAGTWVGAPAKKVR